MTSASIAGVITAIASLVTAIGGVVLAFTVLIPILKNTKETHGIVNQRQTDRDVYERDLKRVILRAGAVVPEDQSVGTPAGNTSEDTGKHRRG